ncbi:MAG: DUF7144 family membrane protein, partial [Trebonia sp.]
LILALMIAGAGLAVLLDMLWARFTGVVMAALIMLANFLYIPYYPFWAILVIALVIIWALLTPPRVYA